MPTAVQNYAQAIGAYNDAARGKPMGDTKPADPLHQDDFASLVKSAVKEAVRIGEKSEQISIAGIKDSAVPTRAKIIKNANRLRLTSSPSMP